MFLYLFRNTCCKRRRNVKNINLDKRISHIDTMILSSEMNRDFYINDDVEK